ncbi:hypothetical protein Q3O60_03820 [Alkalimonas collagenimarina]|uniref:Lipoprotein n=1 Tax=Alkalimonas collagenimarina TaxID=400390 RepID=A0ABT9GWS1_9GAMM|nr:hypothetical protein [Alkalimonas collagenimarina]MDP4535314.1 hypothetical protein [Alkalimonas collagenimarina]
MSVRFLVIAVVLIALSACAERSIDIIDRDGKIVGGCIAGYDWHLYGVQDSIDYMLYQCAKESIAMGYSVSDSSLLEKDFSLPEPPEGKPWNKALAMEHYKKGHMTERQLGYVLAEIEYSYRKTVTAAEDDLSEGKIDQAQFNQIDRKARFEWLGK